MTLAGTQSVTGAKTFGAAGNVGKLIIAGNTSGTTILNANATAGTGTVTLPTTGTLATLDGTETLTNKTLTSATLTTPALGTPSALVGTNITGTAAGLSIGGNAATATTATTATSATTSTNLAAGAGGQIPYQSAAGTTAMLANGTAGQVLQSNGTTLAPTWVTAATGDMTLAGVQSITGAKTFGAAGNVGKLIIAGNTSGTTILNANATAGAGTVTLPTTGVLATLDGTETLTNKTLTSPTLTTPVLGTPASGVMTNVTGLPLTTGVTGILPVANGGTGVANSNTITLGGNINTAGPVNTVGASALTLTTTGATNVTLPASGTLGTVPNLQQLTADVTTSSTTLGDVTGLNTFSLNASSTYYFKFHCLVQTNATSV
ncbi:MAG: hypothetical protein Q8M83_02160, partial [bacterium]|nr:hypothetical protein [bacterium]